mgnify:FL=1
MKLNELSFTKGARKKGVRVGRGIASGCGKTSGRGMNGQNKRSGGGVRPGFEGGQMPLYRTLPKIGFTNYTRKVYAIVNVKDLNQFDEGTVITPVLLKEKGLIKKEYNGVKILGVGTLEKKLTVNAHKFSASATKAIEQAGGKVEVIA